MPDAYGPAWTRLRRRRNLGRQLAGASLPAAIFILFEWGFSWKLVWCGIAALFAWRLARRIACPSCGRSSTWSDDRCAHCGIAIDAPMP